ncbi:MAG: RidA family protein [Erysipelotrichaceae bacterium]|jgi:2-iminobutanoate/2-iminopropanoate deaminase|nr:RidA family protein [Erysipelotrichaceae bacterium]
MFSQPINSPKAPKAIGPYSPAIKLGDFVYLSGQIAIDPFSGNLVDGGIKEQTKRALDNMKAILEEMGLSFYHVVKTTVFLADINDFNDFNEVYATYFEPPYPARSAIGVAALPRGAKVEIEAVVIDTLAYEQQAAGCQGCSGCSDDSKGGGCECCGE